MKKLFIIGGLAATGAYVLLKNMDVLIELKDDLDEAHRDFEEGLKLYDELKDVQERIEAFEARHDMEIPRYENHPHNGLHCNKHPHKHGLI